MIKCKNCGKFFNGQVFPSDLILDACSSKCLFELLLECKTDHAKQYKLSKKVVRSKLEYAFSLFCRNHDIKYIYEPEVINRYLPDFYLSDLGIYIEIKDLKLKHRIGKAIKFSKENPIFIIPAHTIIRLEEYHEMCNMF